MGRPIVRRVLVGLAVAVLAVAPASAQNVPAQVPQPPPQLSPLLKVLAPAASPACRSAGLAGVVLAGQANGVGYTALLPVFEVCSFLPPPTRPAICPADAPLDQAARSVAPGAAPLLPVPTPVATSIDTVNAMNELVQGLTGQSLPPDTLTLLLTTSGCTLKTPAPPPSGGGPVPLPTPGGAPLPAPVSSLPGEAAVPVGHVAADSFAAVPGDASGQSDVATAAPPVRSAALFPTDDDWVPRLLTALILFAVLGPLVLRTGGIRRRRRAG